MSAVKKASNRSDGENEFPEIKMTSKMFLLVLVCIHSDQMFKYTFLSVTSMRVMLQDALMHIGKTA